MSRHTFGLYGIGTVGNYGCEAIIRGTTSILRHRWPDCRLLYTSHRPEADAEALADLSLEFVSETTHIPLVKRVINKVLRSTGTRVRVPVPRFLDWLDEVDCVLLVGGDNFSLWPGEDKAKTFPRCEDARYITDSGKPVVLWGASVGPFEANPRALRAYTDMLRRLSLITVREEPTAEYLASLGIEKTVKRMADPAFVMDADDSHAQVDEVKVGGRPLLGVNFSPLSVQFAEYEAGAEELPKRQVRMIGQLVEGGVDVVLIPHVVCPWKPVDDDDGYLQRVHRSLPDGVAEHVTLLPGDLGARRTKYVISQCRALMSARMHCAIAGLSSAVPTLLLSYSRKAIGMCEYAYGSREWVKAISDDDETIIASVRRLLDRADALRSHLEMRRDTFRADALDAVGYLEELVT